MPRNHDRRNFLIIAVIAIAVIVASLALRTGRDDEKAVDPVAEPSTSASSEATATPAPRHKKREPLAASALAGAPNASVFGLPPGMQGSGSVTSLPPHHVTITWSAPRSAVGVVAWIIPSSQDHEQGKATSYAHSYSLSTTVYGNPKYAAVFAQADVHGNPITCTITVDGRVTEQRTASKPFSAMWCVG